MSCNDGCDKVIAINPQSAVTPTRVVPVARINGQFRDMRPGTIIPKEFLESTLPEGAVQDVGLDAQNRLVGPSGVVLDVGAAQGELEAMGRLPKWRNALAAMRAGTRNAKLCVVSDSTGRGISTGGGTSQFTSSWPSRLAQILSDRGIRARADSWMGAGVGAGDIWAYDSRITRTGTWAAGYATAGGKELRASAAGTLTFTPTSQIDTVETYYRTGSGLGTFTVNFDGGSTLQTVSTSAATGVAKNTATGSLGVHAINSVWSSGQVNIIGQVAYNSAQREVSIINASVAGAQSQTHIDASNVYTAAPMLTFIAADLYIIDLGINDWRNSIPLATYLANLTTLVTLCRAAGGDVAFKTPVLDGATSHAAVSVQYPAEAVALMRTLNVPIIDVRRWWKSYSELNALGWYSDELHPNPAGYWDQADMVSRVLTAA